MRKPTIYEVLCDRLGRTPTNEEIKIECRRIISEAHSEVVAQGKLSNQRKRNAQDLCPSRDFGAHIYRNGICEFCGASS